MILREARTAYAFVAKQLIMMLLLARIRICFGENTSGHNTSDGGGGGDNTLVVSQRLKEVLCGRLILLIKSVRIS